MSETGDFPSRLLAGIAYIQREAIEAHLAGDGARVRHLCPILLNYISRTQPPERTVPISLADVRWSFGLSLVWVVDDFELFTAREALKRTETAGHSQWDRVLINYVLERLSHPLSPCDT